MSDNLTPTAQAILDHLNDHPAVTAADLRQATGRSRSTIDKALADLTTTGLVTKATSDPDHHGDDQGDGEGPARWTLARTTPPDPATPPDQAQIEDTRPPEPPVPPGNPSSPGTPGTPGTETDPAPADTTGPGEGTAAPEDIAAPDDQSPEEPATQQAVEDVKVCRGCGAQMPPICPTCWSKTTSYCGSCRRTHPAARPRTPGQPQILANGLPKLLPGQLEHLVADVITTQPLPDHLGITGWTPGRVAIFLPGRSTGAIANALDKLAATGRAHLLGHDPKRYQPAPTTDPATEHDTGQDDDTGVTTDQQQ